MKNWILYFLPGVFAEVTRQRERAERAEASLELILNQFASNLDAERQESRRREAELLRLVWGANPMPPPEPIEGDGRFTAPVPHSDPISPISRKIEEFKAQLSNAIPEEKVDIALEEYLKMDESARWNQMPPSIQ